MKMIRYALRPASRRSAPWRLNTIHSLAPRRSGCAMNHGATPRRENVTGEENWYQ